MSSEPGFPQVMIHPQHKAAVVREVNSDPNSPGYGLPGSPERFPPIEVHSKDQEGEVRARGYLRYGEEMPKVAEFHEYPKMLHHPDHVDAVVPSQGARMEDGKMIMFAIPGVPERFPAAVARDEIEEAAWNLKGYQAASASDPLAFDRGTVAPGKLGEEWPKWVDGVLTQDPDAPVDLAGQYPKWVHFEGGDSLLANDAAHEARILGGRGASKAETERQPPKPYLPLPAARDTEYEEFLAWKAQKEADFADPGAAYERARIKENQRPPATEKQEIEERAALIAVAKEKAERESSNATGGKMPKSEYEEFGTPAAEPAKDIERESLIELAEKNGLGIDRRWGIARLREVVLGADAPAAE